MSRTLRALFCIWLVACLSFIPALCSAGQLSTNSHGAGEVRQELQRTEEYQRQADERIKNIETAAGNVTDAVSGSRKAVSDAQGTAGRIEADSGRAGAVIAECQQIVAGVRARGTVKATAQ